MSRRRPVVEVLGGLGSARAGEGVAVALGRRCEVRAPDPSLGAPDARVALSGDAPRLDAAIHSRARDGIPVAVVLHAGEDERERELAARVDVVVRLGSAAGDGVVPGGNVMAWPDPSIDTGGHPSVGPLVRARWRRRLGLPDDLAVVRGFPDATTLQPASWRAALAVCAAAAVRGADTPLALALGTPLVTDDVTATALGARDGHDVIVATPVGARDAARALAGDVHAAARIGREGRLLAERCHDTGRAARELLTRLGVPGAEDRPGPHLHDRLAELGARTGAAPAMRAYERCAPFPSLVDTTAR